MKLSKTKKILLLGATLGILATAVVIPLMLLNNNEDDQNKKDVESVVKILEEKNEEKKIITLPVNTQGKIIANNQEKIVEKIKTLIGKANLNGVKIEVLMQDDSNISTIPQKIIIKLTKNEFSKEIKDFSVKKQSIMDVNKDIAAIKNILDAKTGEDLIIILPSSSTGNIIGNRINKIAIIKKIIMLIDSSNKSGEGNHQSLRGTSIQVSISSDAAISTTPQDIIVSISKSDGTTLSTTKTFQVRIFTLDEDIKVISKILDNKTGQDLIITLSSDTTGRILDNQSEIEKKLRILIDSSNTSGDPNHPSLRGTFLVISGRNINKPISTTPQYIDMQVYKRPGTSIFIGKKFQVKKS